MVVLTGTSKDVPSEHRRASHLAIETQVRVCTGKLSSMGCGRPSEYLGTMEHRRD